MEIANTYDGQRVETVSLALFRHPLPLLLVFCSLSLRPCFEVFRLVAAGHVHYLSTCPVHCA